MAPRTNILWGTLVLHLLLPLCLAKSTLEPPKKGKRVSPAMGFLADLTMPIPSSAYNITGRDEHKNEMDLLQEYNATVAWWLDLIYADPPWTDEEIMDPALNQCPTELMASYALNDTCPNASYVSLPYYIMSSLTYTLPNDACNATIDPSCEAWLTSVLEPINKTGKFVEELSKQTAIAEQNQTRSYFRLVGDYIGVGIQIEETCRANINMVLEPLDEWAKAGTAAATTLMALIPALLAVGNLFVPRSSEVFATSFWVGIMSAMFSLGLPVASISGVHSDQCADTLTFSFRTRTWISKFGRPNNQVLDGNRKSANEEFDLSILQKWSTDYDEADPRSMTEEQETTDAAFSKIRMSAKNKWIERTHWWSLPSIIIAVAQLVLFLCAIGPLFLSYGTPLLLFDCQNYWTSAWLLIAAGVSAAFRFIMWEKGVHECVRVYALNEFAINVFREFAENTGLHPDGTKHAHIGTDLPPLYPPLLNAFKLKVRKIFGAFSRTRACDLELYEEIGLFKRIHYTLRLMLDVFLDNLRHPLIFLQSGFSSSSAPNAAMRWRPLVVLMHLSTSGRNPLMTLFTGLVEGFVLLFLTAFFAAQWGGNLFVMCYTTTILLVAITLGRALGLFYVTLSSRSYGLHIIETQDPTETRGCLRILCSMEQVLVHVNGSWFFEGHRLDVRPGWHDFQRCYNLGHLDNDSDRLGQCKCYHPALSDTVSFSSTAMASGMGKSSSDPPKAMTVSIATSPSNTSRRPSSVTSRHQPSDFNNDSSIHLMPIGVQRFPSLAGTNMTTSQYPTSRL